VGSEGSAVTWWTRLERGRVVALAGVDADALTVALDPLPAEAPAVVTYRPAARGTQAAFVAEVLTLLEESAVQLFPAWLPGWDAGSGRGGANLAAVRVQALRLADHTHHFGPFLAELAAHALTGRATATSFPPESRAAGLTRVLTASYDRADVVLLIDVPAGLTARDEQTLVAAAEWLAHRGELGGVWLTGTPLSSVDWIATQRVQLPAEIEALAQNAPQLPAGAGLSDAGPPAGLGLPPLAGQPHPGSPAEQLLERVLATRHWATGRAWNQTFAVDRLVNPVRIDLLWDAEHTAVEVDGAEHWQRVHYAADRVRDVHLQTAGYAVLRFTNDQVLDDVTAVVQKLELFITARRVTRRSEGHSHVG
jgi:very-short-patch-repair endonuclease